MEWRKDLDKELGQYIDELIKKTTFFPAYKDSDKPANAQLWVALGILTKKVYEQELKIRLLEGVLKEISPKRGNLKTKEEINQAKEEVERIMKEIARGKPVIGVSKKPLMRSSVIFPKLKRVSKKNRKEEIRAIKDNIKKNF